MSCLVWLVVLIRSCVLFLGAWSRIAPLLFLLFLFAFFLILFATLELLHGLSDGFILTLWFIILDSFVLYGILFNLLALWVSVHEEIDHNIPFLITWDFT